MTSKIGAFSTITSPPSDPDTDYNAESVSGRSDLPNKDPVANSTADPTIDCTVDPETGSMEDSTENSEPPSLIKPKTIRTFRSKRSPLTVLTTDEVATKIKENTLGNSDWPVGMPPGHPHLLANVSSSQLIQDDPKDKDTRVDMPTALDWDSVRAGLCKFLPRLPNTNIDCLKPSKPLHPLTTTQLEGLLYFLDQTYLGQIVVEQCFDLDGKSITPTPYFEIKGFLTNGPLPIAQSGMQMPEVWYPSNHFDAQRLAITIRELLTTKEQLLHRLLLDGEPSMLAKAVTRTLGTLEQWKQLATSAGSAIVSKLPTPAQSVISKFVDRFIKK